MTATVTIGDVAAAAGVSVATVSRAISRPAAVRDATRARVLTAVEALGYTPNRAARSLSTGRTGTIAVVVADVTDPAFAVLVQAVQAGARDAGFDVLLADTGDDIGEEARLIRTLPARVDGLVVCAPSALGPDLGPLPASRPIVLVDAVAPGWPGVVMDPEPGLRDAIAHLGALGHRHVVSLPAATGTRWEEQRAAAVDDICGAHGIACTVLSAGPATARAGAERAAAVWATGATAAIAATDAVALGLLRGSGALGVAVPAARSVVGGGDAPVAAMAMPPLTTVSMPSASAGTAAVELLLGLLLDGPPTFVAPTVTVPSRLIVRDSTAAAEPRSGVGGASTRTLNATRTRPIGA